MNLKLTWLLLVFSTGIVAQDPESYKEVIRPLSIKHCAIFKNDPKPEVYFKDTIIPNDLYIASIYWKQFTTTTCLLKDAGQHWIAYEISEQSIDISDFQWVNLNHSGQKELLLNYYDTDGRSGWQSGYSQLMGGFMLIDLDALKILIDQSDIQCYTFWVNELEYEDPDDPQSDFEVIGSEVEFEPGFVLKAKVSPNQITITHELADCSTYGKDENAVAEAKELLQTYEPKTYFLKNGRFVIP